MKNLLTKKILVITFSIVQGIAITSCSAKNEDNNVKNVKQEENSYENVSNYNKSIETMEKSVQESMTALNSSAASVILLQNGNILYEKQFGISDKINNIPVTEDTLFNIGSISKVFVTASILKLQQDGKLSIDDPIVKYIPDFKMNDPHYKDITIKMLLNHSSGLPGTSYDNTFLVEGDTNKNYFKNLLADLEDEELKANPGEYSIYCSEGFILAQYIVEQVANINYEDYLVNTLFKPMGLADIYVSSSEKIDDSMFARIYDNEGNLIPREIVISGFSGTGGLSTNAKMLALFAEKILSSATSVLNSESIALLREDQGESTKLGNLSQFNALGWDTMSYRFNQLPVFSKSGGTMHYASQLVVAPDEGITIVGLSTAPAMINGIMETFMIDVLMEKGAIKIDDNKMIVPEESTVDDETLTYAGNYCFIGSPIVMHVGMSDNKLELSVNPLSLISNYDGSKKYIYRQDKSFWSESEDHGKNEKFSFRKIDGKIFLIQHLVSNTINYEIAYAQKMDEGIENQEWLKLNGSTWLKTNVFRNNITRLNDIIVPLTTPEDMEGYVLFLRNTPFKIINDNIAKTINETERDAGNLVYQNGIITFRGAHYINSETIPEFDVDKLKVLVLEEENQAYWYKVTEPLKITPDTNFSDARTIVYNIDGLETFDNISEDGSIVIPADSYIAYSGKKNTIINQEIESIVD